MDDMFRFGVNERTYLSSAINHGYECVKTSIQRFGFEFASDGANAGRASPNSKT
jgi:hypothetical protein